MGNGATSFKKVSKDDASRLVSDMFEVSDDNGYVFWDTYYIPEEVLTMILSYLPPEDLVFVCRRVCKYWCNIIDSQVLKIKLARKNVPVQKIHSLPWFACFWILIKSPLNRNLIKNNCGQERLLYWDILSCGGDGWIIEKPPAGCEDFPKESSSEGVLEHNSCFATSFYSCTKKQLIDLKKEGASPEFMDFVQPHITVVDCFRSHFRLSLCLSTVGADNFRSLKHMEWLLRYCGRFDCSAIYDFKVKLLNENHKTLDEFEVRKHVGSNDGWSWRKVCHVFKNYGPGVQFIEFYHGGMDSQFWKGHYGSKMSGGSVLLSLP